eukprot:2342309-Prymnesium_polylepis.1
MGDDDAKVIQTERDYCKSKLEDDNARADALIAYTKSVPVRPCVCCSVETQRGLPWIAPPSRLLVFVILPLPLAFDERRPANAFIACRTRSPKPTPVRTRGSTRRAAAAAAAASSCNVAGSVGMGQGATGPDQHCARINRVAGAAPCARARRWIAGARSWFVNVSVPHVVSDAAGLWRVARDVCG